MDRSSPWSFSRLRATTLLRRLAAGTAVGLALIGAADSSASPIVFSFDGQGTGTLDGNLFDGFFSVEVVADTDDVDVFGAAASDIFFVDGDATITLSTGIGNFSNLVRVTSMLPIPGLGDAQIAFQPLLAGDQIGFVDAAINEYMLDGALGPVNTTQVNIFDGGGFQLDIGLLQFTTISDLTFNATPIPEPGTGSLGAIGLLALAIQTHRLPRP